MNYREHLDATTTLIRNIDNRGNAFCEKLYIGVFGFYNEKDATQFFFIKCI